MKQSIATKIKSAPHEPGIYIFRNGETILYVGKAADLKNRLRSYLKATDIKTEMLDENATSVEFLPLRSDIEALIEESRLIKELKPKYNVIWRDDKSYYYVYFTNDDFSKVFVGHERPKRIMNKESRLRLNSLFKIHYSTRIGPFTDGAALRLVMRLLRRYFPYCTCLRPHLRDCLNAQIGKCLGFCCKKISSSVIASETKQSQEYQSKIAAAPAEPRNDEKEYRHNIKAIKAILRGHAKKLLSVLTDKEKLALKNIFEHRNYIERERGGRQWKGRIECFDLSNLSGKEAVGVMTVLKDGLPDKKQWRKFKIKIAPKRDDPRMMAEIVSRRLSHPEWLYPDLMIIDGGLIQFRAAKETLRRFQNKELRIKNRTMASENLIHNSLFLIQVISFSKPHKLVYGLKSDEPTPLAELPAKLQKLIEKAIYYTHGFAIRYHRKVRSKELFR